MTLTDKILKQDSNRNYNSFINQCIECMGTLITSPEQIIFKRGQPANSLLFIGSGGAIIKSTSKLFQSGDSFGEIGCLFNCPRTCTVLSTNYTIIGRLLKARLRMLTSDYPLFKEELLRQIYRYKDKQKDFVFSVFQRIQYFKDLNPKVFHEILYNFKEHQVEEGDIVSKPGDHIKEIIIV